MTEATWINIDETPVPYHVSGRAGIRMKRAPTGMNHCLVERATLNQRRAQCTLMAAAVNSDALQKTFPQMLLPNIVGHKKKWRDSASLAAAPPHIKVNKETNGWSTAVSMKAYFNTLSEHLKSKGIHKVVIVMDCHPSHYAWPTINHLRKLKWKVILVPSRLTWLLQPLDAYLFGAFKHRLSVSMAAKRTTGQTGSLTFEEWLSVSLNCISTFFGEAQATQSFQKCGCTMYTASMSQKVKQYISYDIVKEVRRLTEFELQEYMGKKVKHIHSLLFAEPVPAHAAHRKALIHPLAHRVSRKRSLDEM